MAGYKQITYSHQLLIKVQSLGIKLSYYSLPVANIVKRYSVLKILYKVRYSVLKFLYKVRKMHKKLAILRNVNNSAPRHPKFLRLAFLCT